MPRSPIQQSKHNKAVEHLANYYKMLGYRIWADVVGYPTPGTIYAYRPDVIARGNKLVIIVEVETLDSMSQLHHQKQAAAFGRYASKNTNVRFWVKIAR